MDEKWDMFRKQGKTGHVIIGLAQHDKLITIQQDKLILVLKINIAKDLTCIFRECASSIGSKTQFAA